ncbi:MAG TPA: NifU family protein [Micavibrio sp.]|jgi:Fe-S cluster biogenesis protein NfuA
MFIQTEKTPNPEVLKFIPGEAVLKKGTAEFKPGDDVSHSPLAQRFFRLDGVKSVFFGSDFISVTKAGEKDWAVLKTQVLAAIMEHFSTGQPVMNDQTESAPSGSPDMGDEIVRQICELLETRVRPAVQMDGGDIIFDRFEEGIVYLHMRGACSGCPSSTMTLKSGIENMLRHFIPEVVEVRSSSA